MATSLTKRAESRSQTPTWKPSASRCRDKRAQTYKNTAGAKTKETQTDKSTALKIDENRLKGMRVQQKNIQTDET